MSHKSHRHRHNGSIGSLLTSLAFKVVVSTVQNKIAGRGKNPYAPIDHPRTGNNKVGYRNGRKNKRS